MSERKWVKGQSGSARSISDETHGAHLSITDDENFSITVYRRKPEFKNLGQAKDWKEAIAMCDADYEANK